MNLKRIGLSAIFLASALFNSCVSPEKVEVVKKLEQRIANPSKNSRPDKYAFLICGSNEERFEYDLSAIYQTLLRRDFKDSRIFILDQKGEEEFLYRSDGKSTEENVKKVFRYLEQEVDDQDTLVVHIDDHGSRFEEYTNFGFYSAHSVSLSDNSLTKRELGEYLGKIKPRVGIVTVDTCYAEGMLDYCPEDFIRIAGTREDTVGLSLKRDSFGGHFYLSWCKEGIKTIREAFDNAKRRHSFSRAGRVEPQIKSKDNLENTEIP
ncbi:MAG: hypothetical protein ACP5NS_03405 [Candidatus Pacearchaeota archaeon]